MTFRREELAVPLVATIDGDQEDGGAVYGEEGTDGVEFGCEDLEDDEGEGELAEGGAHVGAFKGPLGGPDLSESGKGFPQGQCSGRIFVMRVLSGLTPGS